jgi:cytochrome d ubiquinol oxidase subunit I
VNAWYILRRKHLEIAKPAFKIALVVATFFSLAQLVAGHHSANGVAKNQPAKLAALEGHFATDTAADMYLLGWVNTKKETTTGIKIPGGLSFLVHNDFKAPVKGLQAFPKEDRPSQVNAIFQFYHLMVTIGMLLIALTLFACWQWKRGRLFEQRWLMMVFAWAVLLPQIANQVGWFAAEMGRQPWVVYQLLRTSDALSKAVKAEQVLISLILFTLVYATLFVLFLYLLNKKITHGPTLSGSPEEEPNESFSVRHQIVS